MAAPPRLSVLDLSPIPAGSSASDALRNTIDLAKHAESLGLTRYWLAEHHNAAGLASSAPEIMIGQVAAATRAIRVGAGGIMLPNHSPLKVAELFRVLHALFPSRIDLGLGRAAGTDPRTALALRRTKQANDGDDFGTQLDELVSYLAEHEGARPAFSRAIAAVPTGVSPPDLFILGSSDESAIVAARRGAGFAYAHHLNPRDAATALHAYRDQFTPSDARQTPEAILALSVICADTDEEANRLASSSDLATIRFGQGIRDLPIPTVEEASAYRYDADEEVFRSLNRARHVIGSVDVVRAKIVELVESTGADEVMMVCTVHDHAARRHAYSRVARALEIRTPKG